MSDRSPTNPMLVTHAFSNGTEGHAWTSTWCDYCVHDHGQHMAGHLTYAITKDWRAPGHTPGYLVKVVA